jgi:hypothetical protein
MDGAGVMRRVFLAAVVSLIAIDAQALPKNFDGVWTFEARTTEGACEPQAAGHLTIVEGRVVALDTPGVAPWGYIDDGGVLSARFSQGQDMMRAQGRLKGMAGSGAWSSNTRYCGGVWSAHRAQ